MTALPIIQLIKDIQNYFASCEIDIAHDVGHHYRVWENSMTIIREENITVDLYALQIGAWIHYIDNGKLLQELTINYNFSNALRQKIVKIVTEHSFGQNPTMDESKIVFDADRIELLSVPRWQFVFQAYNDGRISKEKRNDYIARVEKRIPLLQNKLHFHSTNALFLKNVSIFTHWLEKNY